MNYSVLDPFLWVILYFPVIYVAKLVSVRQSSASVLYFWHSIFSAVFFTFALFNNADANAYFRAGLIGEFNWGIGTTFVQSVSVLMVQGLGLSKVGCYLVFNVIGTIGLVFIQASCAAQIATSASRKRSLGAMCVYLPGMSFWTGGIGKDAIAVLGSALILYGICARGRFVAIAFGLALIGFVRPEVAMIYIAVLSLMLFFERRVGSGANYVVALVAAAVLFAPAMDKLGFSEVSSESIASYIESSEARNADQGSSIDLSSLPFPLRPPSYLFRPFFIDADSLLDLIVSFENLVLLVLFLQVIRTALVYRDTLLSLPGAKISLTIFITSTILFSMVTANQGIAVRHKTMALPYLFYLGHLCYLIKRTRRQKS